MSAMLQLPFLAELEKAERVIVAGAGGGFDIFCGLPLYFALRDAGKTVHLANLSFSPLPEGDPHWLTPALLKVTADTQGDSRYFPEGLLSRWFRREEKREVPIYSFPRTGVQPLLTAYQHLVKELQPDTIVLVDGGTDSLMRGDEAGLGTPEEDSASIVAANELSVPRKLLACLGFGVDHYHGVCHAQFLENVGDLTRFGGYLGMFSLHNEMPEVQKYRAASNAVFREMPNHPSIVSSSILSALEGRHGDHHSTTRTEGSTLWINPLMPVYWTFQLEAVAKRLLYRDAIMQTQHYMDVHYAITMFRDELKKTKPWSDIPV
jgi:hypothetical protein